jgi:hypothetical protein
MDASLRTPPEQTSLSFELLLLLGIAPPFMAGQGTDRSNANVLIPVHRARWTFLASAALPPEWCSFGFFNKITHVQLRFTSMLALIGRRIPSSFSCASD